MKRLILTAVVFLSAVLSSSAATVDIQRWLGHNVVVINGDIEVGDAAKIAEVLPKADKMPYGTQVVLLNSPGGSVSEALMISKIFDQSPVHTVIPEAYKCASACASIIFIAGKYRTMEDGSALGQHTCYKNGRADEECNEIISAHAKSHGVSIGSVGGFMSFVAPEDMLWFSRADAEGWGITRYPGVDLSGFEVSEPRVLKAFEGKEPPAQSKWRINFKNNGFMAFVRPISDYEREMQVNVFCVDTLKGKLFLGMEITGSLQAVQDSVLGVSIMTNLTEWETTNPIIHQIDENMSEVVVEIPEKDINGFLTKTNRLVFAVQLKEPYQPMVAPVELEGSKKVLLFAANNCVRN